MEKSERTSRAQSSRAKHMSTPTTEQITDLDELAKSTANKLSRDAILRQGSSVETLRSVFRDLREEGRMLGKIEDGWVIEHGASELLRPRYWSGVHGWTYENLKAVRFSREIDAKSVAESMDDGVPDNYRLAEHAWPLP